MLTQLTDRKVELENLINAEGSTEKPDVTKLETWSLELSTVTEDRESYLSIITPEEVTKSLLENISNEDFILIPEEMLFSLTGRVKSAFRKKQGEIEDAEQEAEENEVFLSEITDMIRKYMENRDGKLATLRVPRTDAKDADWMVSISGVSALGDTMSKKSGNDRVRMDQS